MKTLLTLLATLLLVGCATSSRQSASLPYDQLSTLRYTNQDCGRLDYHIQYLEQQLQARGLLNADPETLNENDRVYNATARIYIWNLRIGCNNPTRFAKK